MGAIREGMIRSAHDCSDGGLAVALAESCISGEKKFGVQINLPKGKGRIDDVLFNEAPSRVVVSISKNREPQFKQFCDAMKVPILHLGKVDGSNFEVKSDDKSVISAASAKLHELWYNSIARSLGE